jgi:hypothetical protein
MQFRLLQPSPWAVAGFLCLLFGTIASGGINAALAATSRDAASRYVVRFDEPALAAYNRSTRTPNDSNAVIPQTQSANGRARLDVHSEQARAYVDFLKGQQSRHLDDIAASIGRIPGGIYSMQHAVNAAILTLSPDEAQRIARMKGIVAVEPDHQLELASDIGPGFTSAESVWWGTSVAPDDIFANGFFNQGYQGDGVVIGVIDTGYNSLSPSFQAIDSQGHRIANPLGHGVFLGQCHVAGISAGGCNDKVIGVYDEAGLASGLSSWVYSVEDATGHGSHTASTAAGNRRSATLSGYSAQLAGVAPHANLVIYRACTPNTGCAWTAIVASIDQAIADGIIDALNFSVGDSAGPWADPIAHAFLSATEAGIFVAAAAGNTSSSVPTQVAGSAINTAPWIATIGAGTHSGGAILGGARAAEQADELAPFSLLGPATFAVIKPDLQAPGTHILAASDNDGTATGAGRVAMMDGTSMATAHTTGSGALLLGLHPDWTPFEVKSALMMTAKESGLTKADGVTASNYFDRGSGRLQEFAASKAGLVMDETGTNMANADPTWGTGDPSTLNLASMQSSACSSSCSFNRWFHSTQDHTVTWTARAVAGPNPGFSSVSATPTKFTLNAFANSPSVTFRADSSRLPADGKFHFAEIVLTPDDTHLSPLHLIVAVAVP